MNKVWGRRETLSLCGSVCSVLLCLCPQCLRLLAKPVKYRKNLLLLLQVGDQYCGYTVLHVALCILVSWVIYRVTISCVISVVLHYWLIVLHYQLIVLHYQLVVLHYQLIVLHYQLIVLHYWYIVCLLLCLPTSLPSRDHNWWCPGATE